MGKRNLTVTVANQYYKQLSGETLDAIIGNVGSIIAFRVGDEDARQLAQYFRPAFSPDDLVQLEDHHAAVWSKQAAFSLTTEKPLKTDTPDQRKREAYLRQHARERYSPMTRAQVLSWIEERYVTVSIAPPVTERRYDPDA